MLLKVRMLGSEVQILAPQQQQNKQNKMYCLKDITYSIPRTYILLRNKYRYI